MHKQVARNSPCPCWSGKKFMKCCMLKNDLPPSFSWTDKDGIHFMVDGEDPTVEQYQKLTEEYQRQIRHSPVWEEMVREFGSEKAEELLKECKDKPG